MAMSLWIVRQVAEALAALHDATQMIHSDVKPATSSSRPTGTRR